ncbi:MAG: DUF3794 domain-containing protein [Hydrogenoanaerobacterium sp.]
MDLKLIKEAVAINEAVCDFALELPIECDVLLPEYCPDILRLLKCCATPILTRTAAEGGTVTAEGYTLLELYYTGDDEKMHCSEHKVPFIKNIDLKTEPENMTVSIYFTVGYINCRAVNNRRADIRGAMTMNLKAFAEKSESAVCGAEGAGVQLRKSTMESTCILGCNEKQFTVRDELELGYGKLPVGTVMRKEAVALVTECKVISNKAVVKGELILDIFYLSAADNEPQAMKYNLPISQIIDLQGAEDDCSCDVRFRVMSADIQPKADLDGEATVLVAEVTLCATAKAYRTKAVMPVCDAYSTEYEIQLEERPVTVIRLLKTVNEAHDYKELLELPADASRVLHLWCTGSFKGITAEENSAALAGQLTLCMFAEKKDNDIVYFEKAVDFVHKTELAAAENLAADITMLPVSCEFSDAGGGNIELRAQVNISGIMYVSEKHSLMQELSVDGESPRQQSDGTALTIYFAQQGECVWDIAKHYHTSVAAVMEENSIEKENLEAKATLLIPLVV